MRRSVCLHGLPELATEDAGALGSAVRSASREELLLAVGTLDMDALVINLDDPGALDLVVAVRELKPQLPIVGATGQSDVNHLIAAQRAGCTQITSRPIELGDLLVAMRLATSVPSDEEAIGSFAVFSATGGAGGTTFASYLAVELARITRRQTALVDLDLAFGGVANILDLSTPFTLAHLAGAEALDGHMLQQAAAQADSDLHAFVRAPTIEEAFTVNETALCNIIRSAKEHYPCTVFDLPRILDNVTTTAFQECDKLILVLELTLAGLDNAKRLIDAIARAGTDRDRIEIVVNRYRRGIHACSIDSVAQHIGQQPLGVVPNDYHAVRKAIDMGERLSLRCPVRSEISRVANRLIGKEGRQERGSWFNRLVLGR